MRHIKPVYHWKKQFQTSTSSACFSPNGRFVAFGSGENLTIRDALSGELKVSMAGHKGTITHVNFSPDGNLICTVSKDKTLKIWRVRTSFHGKDSTNVKIFWDNEISQKS